MVCSSDQLLFVSFLLRKGDAFRLIHQIPPRWGNIPHGSPVIVIIFIYMNCFCWFELSIADCWASRRNKKMRLKREFFTIFVGVIDVLQNQRVLSRVYASLNFYFFLYLSSTFVLHSLEMKWTTFPTTVFSLSTWLLYKILISSLAFEFDVCTRNSWLRYQHASWHTFVRQ